MMSILPKNVLKSGHMMDGTFSGCQYFEKSLNADSAFRSGAKSYKSSCFSGFLYPKRMIGLNHQKVKTDKNDDDHSGDGFCERICNN